MVEYLARMLESEGMVQALKVSVRLRAEECTREYYMRE